MNIFKLFLLITGINILIKDFENLFHKKSETGKIVQFNISPAMNFSSKPFSKKDNEPADGIKNLKKKLRPYIPIGSNHKLFLLLNFRLTFFYNQNAAFVEQGNENGSFSPGFFSPIEKNSLITLAPIPVKGGKNCQLKIVREIVLFQKTHIRVISIYLEASKVFLLVQFPELLLAGTPDYVEVVEDWFFRRFLKKLLKKGLVEINENHLLKTFNLKYDRYGADPFIKNTFFARYCYKNKYFELSRISDI